MTTSSTMTERRDPTETNVGSWIGAVTFSTNGEYLLSGGRSEIQVWRVEDGKRTATMEAKDVRCLAVSKDGRWVAAGTGQGHVLVWDAETHEHVFEHRKGHRDVNGVDFSPDSTRLVSASENKTASIWDTATGERVITLDHDNRVIAAKYSPEGDRIATGTPDSVRVYHSSNGRFLVDIDLHVKVTPWRNRGLLWINNHLLVVSDSKIKQIETSTGSLVSEWPIPGINGYSCIAQSKRGGIIAISTGRTVSFWDAATHIQLGVIQHTQDIRPIAVSPDDRFLAIGGKFGEITIHSLSHINASIRKQGQSKHDNPSDLLLKEPSKLQSLSHIDDPISKPRSDPTFQEPYLHIDDAVLDLWKQDQLTNAEALLTASLTTSQNTNHHLLASRALVRTRLQEWDTAIVDAEKAIKTHPSVVAYIAKSIALVGKGERYKGYRTCDIAFAPFHSSHVNFLLLTKAIIVFMAGEHLDAISRVDDLIATVPPNSIYYIVQSYMYFLIGNSCMQSSDYEGAIESFKQARTKMRHNTSPTLLVISLISGWKFDNLSTTIQQCLCEALYTVGRTEDAVKCLHEMTSELGGATKLPSDRLEWVLNFKQRSFEKLQHLGDAAANAQKHDEAIFYYTTALSLDLPSPQGILIKRSKAYVATGSWKQALDDANQVVVLDPSSPWGYEIRHAALHKGRDYDNAVHAFEAMLSRIEQSPDPAIRQHRDQYKTPSKTRMKTRRIVERTLRDSPHMLIDTTTGCLRNRAERAAAFESLPIFNELVSSMTTRIDRVRIKREVQQYFRYVMLSHKWEDNEPLFHQVIHMAVYDLDPSPTHDKLHMFCKIARDAGFNWAWSDTCCIDTGKHDVHQEALVAMFKWYRGSALMIVFLRGVFSLSQLGALAGSIWNTRGWTLQEYIAAKVIHFYTEDWTPYLNLELPNHKESPEVISEMEQATGVSSQQLMALRPGLVSIREKLRLASTRRTERVEDAAYSLLGIFSVTGIPPIYGEGEAALGRLLSHVLAGSGDVSILAWTGESGSFNSCLPAHIAVFNGPATSHFPSPIPDDEMERMVTASYTSSFDLDVALRLYDRLSELPPPWFAASRMKLPCIVFQLPPLSSSRTRSGRVYRADTLAFGMVEITTRHDLSRMTSLYLVHPWLDSLLEQEHVQSGAFVEDDDAPLPSDNEDVSDDEFDGESSSVPEPEPPSHPARVPMAPVDEETRARRLVARLRRPFGALLVALASTGRRAPDYRRVAADSSITVQFRENVSLADILDNVRTLDVL